MTALVKEIRVDAEKLYTDDEICVPENSRKFYIDVENQDIHMVFYDQLSDETYLINIEYDTGLVREDEFDHRAYFRPINHLHLIVKE
jgi:hypothetical protein